MTLASFYLEGEAQLGFQMLKQEMFYNNWEDFKNKIFSRFGPNQFKHFGELIKLWKIGTVVEYQANLINC